MMPHDYALLTLAQRTRENLKHIYEEKSKGESVNEFTQLLNSMLCMVIGLREEYLNENRIGREEPEVPLKNIAEEDFSEQLIANLRHAFAHGNFRLIPASDGSIAGVRVWNIPPGKKKAIWKADITEKTANRFSR